jgi:spermidine dehydrogenase
VPGGGVAAQTTTTGILAFNPRDVDKDDYDLVVVGAGASGLAAAKWYQDRFGAGSKILLIDSLPDFGGHSHRNEFHIPDATNGGADVMLLRNGATGYLQRTSHGLFAAGIQCTQAGDTWALENPGFDGLGLEPTIFPGIGRTAQQDMMPDADPTVAWPDGNASLLRLLVGKLIPGAIGNVGGAPPTQDNILVAKADYTQLDRPSNTVRIRLNSTVAEVVPGREHCRRDRGRKWRKDDLATITYVTGTGWKRRAERVRARHVVMACWNRVTARIVDGLPRDQVKNLCYARKAPLVYCRVGLNNWNAFAAAKISSVSPRGNSLFWDSTTLSAGQRFGSSYGPTPNTPGQPAHLTLSRTPDDPRALTQLESYERGRELLLNMSFGDFEDAIVDVIDRTVNTQGGNFEPERDINSIIVNRWNYGYAYELCSTFDPSLFGPVATQPHVLGRRLYKNVAIANSDSGAFAYTHSAINEAHRAVTELPD